MVKLETSTFLDLLLSTTDHHEHILPVDPDDPKLYWILRDADFKVWEPADDSQMLWLFGGPPGCSMTGVSSFIAKKEASRRDGPVLYISCSMEGANAITSFTHSVLRYILNGSDARQAELIIESFLSTLLLKIIQRDRSRFKDASPSVISVEEILKAKRDGLLDALTEAVVEIRTIQNIPIIIDGIDKIGPDGARFFTRFWSIQSPKPKVLLICRADPSIKEIVGAPCIDSTIIEYDRERQGLRASYLVVSLANLLMQSALILLATMVPDMIRSKQSIMVLWSGSGNMTSIALGHPHRTPIYYLSRESQAVEKAPLQSTSRIMSWNGNH
jgi:hypothetical protein